MKAFIKYFIATFISVFFLHGGLGESGITALLIEPAIIGAASGLIGLGLNYLIKE
jgi:hypothetical protein